MHRHCSRHTAWLPQGPSWFPQHTVSGLAPAPHIPYMPPLWSAHGLAPTGASNTINPPCPLFGCMYICIYVVAIKCHGQNLIALSMGSFTHPHQARLGTWHLHGENASTNSGGFFFCFWPSLLTHLIGHWYMAWRPQGLSFCSPHLCANICIGTCLHSFREPLVTLCTVTVLPPTYNTHS